MSKYESIIGTFAGMFFRSKDTEDTYSAGSLSNGTIISGKMKPDDEPIPGVEYEFYGKYRTRPDGKKEFRIADYQYSIKSVHSKTAIVNYLRKFADIPPASSSKLYDTFGDKSIDVLRETPEVAQKAVGHWLSMEKANNASKKLRESKVLESVRIGLYDLFLGHSLPRRLVDDCVKKWGLNALEEIKKNPYLILIEGFRGCGFAKVDSLYKSLGLPLDSIDRQMFLIWYIVKSDKCESKQPGDTWINARWAMTEMKNMLGMEATPKAKEAVIKCLSDGWIVKYRDNDNELWIADSKKGNEEEILASKIAELLSWDVTNEENSLAGRITTKQQSDGPPERAVEYSNV